MNALRHVTYRKLAPWKPLDELLLMPIGLRIKYVRTNLGPARPDKDRRKPYLTHDEFAVAVGAKNRYRPIAWEKGETPRDYASAIAKLTDYPEAAMGGDGEAELFELTLGRTLRSLRDEVAWMRTQLARAFAALGLELPEEERPAQSAGVPP